MTFIKLLKMTILFQKIINSVAQFMRIIIRIFRDYIFDKIKFFFDDIEIKKSKTIYNDETIIFNICKYMTKHIQWLNDVFVDIERANCTISNLKSHFCMKKLKIIEYVCNVNEKHSNVAKINKIIDWSKCRNATKTRIFIKLCVYYRIWMKKFVQIVEFIYKLMKKNIKFV